MTPLRLPYMPTLSPRLERVFETLPMAAMGWGYVGFAGVVRIFDVGTIPVCAFRALTGQPCPLCGITHAFGCLMVGDIAGATHLNALAVPTFVGWLVMSVVYTTITVVALNACWRGRRR